MATSPRSLEVATSEQTAYDALAGDVAVRVDRSEAGGQDTPQIWGESECFDLIDARLHGPPMLHDPVDRPSQSFLPWPEQSTLTFGPPPGQWSEPSHEVAELNAPITPHLIAASDLSDDSFWPGTLYTQVDDATMIQCGVHDDLTPQAATVNQYHGDESWMEFLTPAAIQSLTHGDSPYAAYGASAPGPMSEVFGADQLSHSHGSQRLPEDSSYAALLSTGDAETAGDLLPGDVFGHNQEPLPTPASGWPPPREHEDFRRGIAADAVSGRPDPVLTPLVSANRRDGSRDTQRGALCSSPEGPPDTAIELERAPRAYPTDEWACDWCGNIEHIARTMSSLRPDPNMPYGDELPCCERLAEKRQEKLATVRGVCRDDDCPWRLHVRDLAHLRGPSRDSCSSSAPFRFAARVLRSSWIEEVPGGYLARCSAPGCVWSESLGQLSKSMKSGELPAFFGHSDACKQLIVDTNGLLNAESIARWCWDIQCEQGCPRGHLVKSSRYMSIESPFCVKGPPRRTEWV